MLGRDVVAAAAQSGHDVLGLARGELDVTDGDAVRATLRDVRPDAVVNCAAYTDVDGAESDLEGAAAVNEHGAGEVAGAAADVGALVVHVSTDYVFSGDGRDPYLEGDATGPQSVYGETKLAGERAVAAANPRHVVARSSWLFGVGGRNFVDTMLRVGPERGEVSVVTDQVGCPTFTGHLAAALVRLAAGDALGLHHLAGGGVASWFELAEETFRLAGVDCRVLPARTADMARPAPRPAYSVLGSTRERTPRLPPWPEGLAAYLAARPAPRGATA